MAIVRVHVVQETNNVIEIFLIGRIVNPTTIVNTDYGLKRMTDTVPEEYLICF